MRKTVLLVILSVIVFHFPACARPRIRSACFDKACVYVEIADNDQERAAGLMFRQNMEDDQGMLFIFEGEGMHNFHMKNVRFPLDIIWISGDKKVAYIFENAQPCMGNCPVIQPGDLASYVLEVNGGFVKRYGIKIGDSVILR